MDNVKFSGWKNNVRLTNGQVELIITRDVGPRIIRFAYVDERNLFAEMQGQQGGAGESEWMIRGGHRLWLAPEENPKTYELDNLPVGVEPIPNGVRTVQPTGPLSGVQKTMEITLDPAANRVKVVHILKNKVRRKVRLAPWALSVMAQDGMAIVPLPPKIKHTDRLTHNQEWSLWGYTDFTDPRWTLGSRFILFRQDRKRGPAKLGLAHREGWVAYLLAGYLFVKRFAWQDGVTYPDGGVNFETFSGEDFLELETLGPLVDLAPGAAVSHDETWELHKGVPACKTEADVERNVVPLVGGGGV